MPTNLDAIRRLVALDFDYTRARLRVPDGNPLGVGFAEFGTARAVVARELPLRFFNRVVGLRRGDADRVPEVAAFYGPDPWSAEVVAGDLDEPLADALAARGLRHTGFHSGLAADASAVEVTPVAGVKVHRVGLAELPQFVEVLCEGWSVAPEHRAPVDEWAHWLDNPGWQLFLATVADEPAAVASLVVDGDAAYLADAATAPAFRGRGAHGALIAHRVAVARELGARVVFGQAEPHSASERNMLGRGLRLLCHKAIWTRTSAWTEVG